MDEISFMLPFASVLEGNQIFSTLVYVTRLLTVEQLKVKNPLVHKINKKKNCKNNVSTIKVLPSTSIGIPDTIKSAIVTKINCISFNIIGKNNFLLQK